MENRFVVNKDGTTISSIVGNAIAITASDTEVLTPGYLYVGTGGTLKVKMQGGMDATFTNVADGSFLPIIVTMVYSTGTVDCANILLLY